jgi:hypothetical protein
MDPLNVSAVETSELISSSSGDAAWKGGFFAGPEVQQHWSDEVWEPGDLTVTGSPNS